MRISVVTNSRIPSLTANSIQVMKVCQAFVQLGHVIRLFAPRETEPADWEHLSAHYGLSTPFELEWLPSAPALKRYDFAIYSILATRKFKADIVYTWMLNPAVLALWLGWPVVLEMHAEVTGRLGPELMRRFWRARGRKRMLATTRPLRDSIEKVAGLALPEDATQIAANGVDLDRYENLPDPVEARHRLGLEEKLTLGFTGHIYPGRGADLLFDLAQRIRDVNILWVGGRPTEVDYWRTRLVNVGATNVIMTGFVENSRLPLYQAAADILLMPYNRSISASSGQDIGEVINPMKMFEYMAAKRAIVSADLPVIREVLNDRNAVFCAPGNIDAWEAELRALLADEKRRSMLGHQAGRDVEKYTWIERARRALDGIR